MAVFRTHIALQHDWKDILRSPGQKAWVTCTREGEKNVYGEISIQPHDSKNIQSTDGIQANLLPNNNIKLTFGDTTSSFYTPKISFKNIHQKAITSLDVSPGGSLGVSSSEDGALHVWQTEDGKLRRTLEGHVSDVTHCRFFPSGMVVLSGGSDMRVKIWSVEDGSCPVTLTGHSGAITDTCLIDRGRNFISCSRDGYAKLWDCSTAQCLVDLVEGGAVINACLLSSHTYQPTSQVLDKSDNENGTEGKCLVIAKEDGTVAAIDVSSREKAFQINMGDAINDCCFIDEYRLVAGQQNGTLTVVDTRKASEPQVVLKHGKSSVNCVEAYFRNNCIVGRSDGSCTCLCLDNTNTSELVTQELLGSNQDPIYEISISKDSIYTACRDGVVRKYVTV